MTFSSLALLLFVVEITLQMNSHRDKLFQMYNVCHMMTTYISEKLTRLRDPKDCCWLLMQSNTVANDNPHGT